MDFNAAPYDDYTPSPSRQKPRHFKKNEFVHFTGDKKFFKKITTERRAHVQLQSLDGDIAKDVVEKKAPVILGQYKWRDGYWYAISQDDPEEWMTGCEVRGISSRSLPEVIRRGGRVTAQEKKRMLSFAAGEGKDAATLKPNPAPLVTEESAATEEAEGSNTIAVVKSRQSKSGRRRRAMPDPEKEWSARKRTSRKSKTMSDDLLESGSDIEVAQPTPTLSSPKRRRRGHLDFPYGLDGVPTAPAPVVQIGEYLWPRAGWCAILPTDPSEWVNGRPVRNVPAEHRSEILRRGGIFEDLP